MHFCVTGTWFGGVKFEGACRDERYSYLNQEKVPYYMAGILAEGMNGPLVTLPELTEPQKSRNLNLNGFWLEKYRYGMSSYWDSSPVKISIEQSVIVTGIIYVFMGFVIGHEQQSLLIMRCLTKALTKIDLFSH